MSLPIRAFTAAEVKAALTKPNTRKAPRYDLISGQILKRLPRKTAVLLTAVLNRMLTLSYFPVLWKYAEIIMIPKPGKPPPEPTYYRPISLLPISSKLFERLILQRINEEHNPSTLLPSHQFCCRERHSTTPVSVCATGHYMTSSELMLVPNGPAVCGSHMYSGMGSAVVVWLLECENWYTGL